MDGSDGPPTAPAADGEASGEGFVIDDMSTGLHASGFGRVGDGRSFSFQVERQTLLVDVYRPRMRGPVPQAEDVVATFTRQLAHVDVDDVRSLSAVIRDAVAEAQPVPRPGR